MHRKGSLYLKVFQYGKFYSLLLLIATIFLGGWPIFEIYLIKQTVNSLQLNKQNESIKMLIYLFSAGILTITFFIFSSYLQERVKDLIKKNLESKLFQFIHHKSFEETLASNERNRINTITLSIENLYVKGVPNLIMLVQTVITALLLSITLLFISKFSSLFILLGVLINHVITSKAATIQQYHYQSESELDRLQSQFFKILSKREFSKEIRTSNIFDMLNSIWVKNFNKLMKKRMKNALRVSFLESAAGFAGKGLILTVLILGLFDLYHHHISVGELTALMIGSLYLDNALSLLFIQGKDWKANRTFIESILLQQKDTLYRHNQIEKTLDTTNLAVLVNNLSYRYPGHQKNVLDNVSIKINKGEKIAIVGKNGTGKTTLTHLLLGLLKPSKGSIHITNVGGFALQDYNKYKLSIKENIDISNTHSDDSEIMDILELVDLSSLLEKNDLDTTLWPEIGGIECSEGQWQKLAIGRGLFKQKGCKHSVFIMDEPTSSLDPHSELKVISNVIDFIGDNTFVFVVHRLIGCSFADRVILMDQGKIVDIDTHDHLLDKNPMYKEMWEASWAFSEGAG